MDKLVVVTGVITAGLGIRLPVVHLMYLMLSDAYVSGGGIGGAIVGTGMIIWGRRFGNKKDVEQFTWFHNKHQ